MSTTMHFLPHRPRAAKPAARRPSRFRALRFALMAVIGASILAGCITMGTSPQLKRYQADRDRMMFTNNTDKS